MYTHFLLVLQLAIFMAFERLSTRIFLGWSLQCYFLVCSMFFSFVLYQGQFLHLDLQSLHELLIFHPFSAAVMAKDSSVKTQLLHKDSILHTVIWDILKTFSNVTHGRISYSHIFNKSNSPFHYFFLLLFLFSAVFIIFLVLFQCPSPLFAKGSK